MFVSQLSLVLQPLTNNSSELDFKYILIQSSVTGATQDLLFPLQSSHDLSLKQDKHFKLNTEKKNSENALIKLNHLLNKFILYAVHMFSNKSQMSSKCDKNGKVTHNAQPSVSLYESFKFKNRCLVRTGGQTLGLKA